MRAELADDAVLDDRDPVGVVGGVQPVGDGDHRATVDDRRERPLEVAGRARVEQRRRLVEHEGVRVGQHEPRQRELLPLGLGERVPTGADDGVQTVGEGGGPPRGIHRGQRLVKLVVGCLRAGQPQVLGDGADEDVVLLGHEGHLAAQHRQLEVDQGNAATGDPAGARPVDAGEQPPEGRLARPRRADDGQPFAGLETQ